jgi:sulfonate transport system substrate-binding protein
MKYPFNAFNAPVQPIGSPEEPEDSHATGRPTARRRVRRAMPAVAAAAVAIIAAACSSASAGGSGATPAATAATGASAQAAATGSSLSQVTLHVGDQAGAGAEALLKAAGLLGKLPFKVTWSDFTSGPPMLQAMGAGSVDFGSVGDAPPVFAAAGGNKIDIVGALESDPRGTVLLVPKGSPIQSIAQLRGKRIAVSQGSSADYHLLTVLKKAGLSVHDVSLDYLQPAEALAAFSSGSVDAWDIWSPFGEQAQAQAGARVLVDGNGYGSPYGFEVASQAALADPARTAAIRDLLILLNQAHTWADTHPAAWAAVWAQGTGLPAGIMLNAAKDAASVPVPVTPAVVAAEQRVSDAFTTAGLIPGHVNFADFVDTRFNSIIGSS